MTKFLEMIYEAAKKEDEERIAKEKAAAEKRATEFIHTVKIIENFIDSIPSRDDIKINAEDEEMIIPIFKENESEVFKALYDCSKGNVYDFKNVKTILMIDGYFVKKFYELEDIDYEIRCLPPIGLVPYISTIHFIVTWKYHPQ